VVLWGYVIRGIGTITGVEEGEFCNLILGREEGAC